MYLCTLNCIVYKPDDNANVLVYDCFVLYLGATISEYGICKYFIKIICNYDASKMCVKSCVTSKAWNPPSVHKNKCAKSLRNKVTLCLTVFVDSIYTRMYPVKCSVNKREYY
jgi:hypothetical protein